MGYLPPLTNLPSDVVNVDASFAAEPDTRRSQTGYIFFLACGPVSWQSRLQTSVALSSMEAEYMAVSAATQEVQWLHRILQQLGIQATSPMVLFEDNKAAIMFSDHPGDHRKTKHIDTRHHYARDAVLAGVIRLVSVTTDRQIADGLTKALPPLVHYEQSLPSLLTLMEDADH